MTTAHLLFDLSKTRDYRATYLAIILEKLGFRVMKYTPDIYVNKELAENFETQLSRPNGQQLDYAQNVTEPLLATESGDIIVATEAWHSGIFRGVLDGSRGFYGKAPVIEIWIDYPDSFAQYRVFSSCFALNYTLGRAHDRSVSRGIRPWVVGRPYFETGVVDDKMHVWEATFPSHWSYEHIENHMSKGNPVIAPDWGVWTETIKHGVNGYLFRSKAGQEAARGWAKSLSKMDIVNSVAEIYSADASARTIRNFLASTL